MTTHAGPCPVCGTISRWLDTSEMTQIEANRASLGIRTRTCPSGHRLPDNPYLSPSDIAKYQTPNDTSGTADDPGT